MAAEEELRAAHEAVRALADMTSSLLCVFRLEPDGNVVPEWVSDSFVRFTGYTIDECRTLPSWLELIVEADRAIAMERFRGLLEGNETNNETQLLRKQGDVRLLRVAARPLRTAEHTRIVVVARDITDEERTEAALREAKTLNEQILACANEGILVIDREYRYLFWNPRMEHLTGVPKERVLGQTPWDTFPFLRGSGLDVLLERAFSGEQVTSPDFRYEVPSTKQSGWAVQKMAPLRDASGRVTAAIVVVEDITERKRNEEEREKLWMQLVQSQKMEAIGRLASGVAHDFNNLLGVILALSENAQAGMHREDPLWSVFSEIRQTGERAAAMTRQLLAFCRTIP
jgi:PAS domain S-box-containing protein